MEVNLKKFKVFTDLKKTKSQIMDFQENLAEFIYTNGGGFKSSRLANKIADGKDGKVELTDADISLIFEICDNSNMLCYVLMSLHELLENKEQVNKD